jgi:nicotinamidase-related amidase
MPVLSQARSLLLIVDVQEKLIPAIHSAGSMMQTIQKLASAADLLDIPVLLTEQYPSGLGPTIAALAGRPTVVKNSFDATLAAGFFESLPADRPDILLAGCEAHVCVLQTAMGLRRAGRRTILISDAVGSRVPADKAAALQRAAEEGVECVTSEMALFEWLQSRDHPRFREILALIR